jgi:hypothetical protein
MYFDQLLRLEQIKSPHILANMLISCERVSS